MKKNIIILVGLLNSILAFSQVGINTSNPQGVFNVDGGKDNPTVGLPTLIPQQNDFVVTASGNVGIGTTLPSQKLEIQTGGTITIPVTGFKLEDGNQVAGFVLTSDSNGIGTWKSSLLPIITGVFGAGVNIMNGGNGTTYYDTGTSITLPPGKWLINVTQLLVPAGDDWGSGWLFIRSTFADNNTGGGVAVGNIANPTSDINSFPQLISFSIQGDTIAGDNGGGLGTGEKYSTGSGTLIINNTSGATKTYYYIVGSHYGSLAYQAGPISPNANTPAGTYISPYSASGMTPTTSFIAGFSGPHNENSLYAIPIN